VPEEWHLVELTESPSRRGYGPQGRALSPADRLMLAAMELLYRDDDLVDQVRRLAAERPDCAVLTQREMPTRLIVEHVSVGDHAVGVCRDWVAEAIGLCHALGCPSLDTLLAQVAYGSEGLRPGRLRATRLRPHAGSGRVSAGSPRRPMGTFNRPARNLLARRAHAVGGLEALRNRISAVRRAHGLEGPGRPTWTAQDPNRGWNSLARELEAEIELWRDGHAPERRDITYPAWREWSRGRWRGNREQPLRAADDEVGRYLRRSSADIDSFLEATLPGLV